MEQCYTEVKKDVVSNTEFAVKNDIKVLQSVLVIGQIELWDVKVLLNDFSF